MRDVDLTTLNPGIRRTVAFLRANGFETIDSGDGRTHEYECDQPTAYVHMLVATPDDLISETQRLYDVLGDRIVFRDPVMDGDTVTLGPMVEAHYSPRDGIATISLWHVDDALLEGHQAP
jgi:hypothetical protein